jgi:single-strand DNA-binding protein
MANGFTMNSVFLSGNLTRDPEVRYTPNGTAVASFGLAVNNRKKQGDQWVDDPCFIDVTAFGKMAEMIGESFDKGTSVVVEGRLQYRTWEANDGTKRNKHEIIAELIKPIARIDGGSKSSGRGGKGGNSSEYDDSDIPF